jgi:glycine cleavage system aminomethyltransferase T
LTTGICPRKSAVTLRGSRSPKGVISVKRRSLDLMRWDRSKKRLVGWVIEASQAPPANTELLSDGKVVGRLTSIAPGDLPGRFIALGYARRSHFEPGAVAAWQVDGAEFGRARVI